MCGSKSFAKTKWRLSEEVFGNRLEDIKQQVVYIGDSPNDEPMFSYFPNAVGVANVQQIGGKMNHYPAWVTQRKGGVGFAEMMVDGLLS